MFGYVTPYKSEMKIKEFETYRSVYCGLCKELGRSYGAIPRLFLNYDFVFLALLLQNDGKDGECHAPCRCLLHPTQKRSMCSGGKALFYVAGLSILLSYHKVLDNIADSVWYKKIGYTVVKWVMGPSYRKAKKNLPQIDTAIRESICRLHGLEEEKSDHLDMAAATFADMMEQMVVEGTEDPLEQRIYGEIGKHIGRWIYIMDAFADMEEDLKQGSYNPLFYRFSYDAAEGLEAFRERIRERIDFTLVQSLSTVANSYELMEQGPYSPILQNIIYMGLPAKQQTVLAAGTKGEE